MGVVDFVRALPIWQLIASAVAIWLVYSLGLISYRLYAHPLAKFPGPKIAAATQLYEFYHDVIRAGQYQWVIKRMHDRYGPIVRISPCEIHIHDPDFYDDVYTAAHNPRDKWSFTADLVGAPTAMFTALTAEAHRAKRAPLSPFFSKRSVVQLCPVITEHVEKLCARIEAWRGMGVPCSLRYAFAALTLDVISDYCFAQPYRALDDPEFLPHWLDAFDSLLKGCYYNAYFPWLPPLMKKLPPRFVMSLSKHLHPIISYQLRITEQVKGVMRDLHADKYTAGGRRTIFFELLRSADLPEEEKSVVHLVEEGQVLISAGQITTSAHLSLTAFHILSNPQILERVKAELQRVMPDPQVLPSLSELENLEYLSAVIAEGHRKAHGVIHRLQRISPKRPIVYKQWTIPPGTPVGMSQMFVHEHPAIFPSPEKFDPSRFLGPDGLRRKKYLVPFSRGTRSCIGQNLAQAELYFTLAAVFRRFDLEVYRTCEEDFDIVADYLAPELRSTNGLRVLVK